MYKSLCYALLLLITTGSSAEGIEQEFQSENFLQWEILVPPGGYAYARYDSIEGISEPVLVSTIAPGPAFGISDSRLTTVLTPEAEAAIVLSPEWLRDDLKLRFGDLITIPIDVGKNAVPYFHDVDGDGLSDLIVYDGFDNKHIFLAPCWTIFENTSSVDFEALETGADINGDGNIDFAFPDGDGAIRFDGADLSFNHIEGFRFGEASGTALADVEGDGLADLIVGTSEGKILVYRNHGSVNIPFFVPFLSNSQILFPMEFGLPVVPDFAFLGYDQPSLIVGTHQGDIRIFHPVSEITDNEILFSGWREDTSSAFNSVDIGLNLAACPVQDTHEELELICGSRNGTVHLIILSDNLTESRSELLFDGVSFGSYSSPAYGDVTGDGIDDLVIGTREGDVILFRGIPDGNSEFAPVPEQLPGIESVSSGSPVVTSDGCLVMGQQDGTLSFFRLQNGEWQDDTANSPVADIDVGEFSSPAFTDLDLDGTPELVVGNGDGNLTCFILEKCDDREYYVERYSWEFTPNSAVSDLNAYYGRYFPEGVELQTPSETETVSAFALQISEGEQKYIDEIAYSIAHTPTEVLRTMYRRNQADILSINAACIYSTAEEVEYARLTELEDETVLELRTETAWVPVERSIYYNFVVHPRILFEIPSRIDAGYWLTKAEERDMEQQGWLQYDPDTLYGISESHHFWRSFLPQDDVYGRRLSDWIRSAQTAEQAVLTLSNFLSWTQPGSFMEFGYLTNDLQPMVIYEKAYGSCGEQSILQCALCRALLIPAYVVGCRGEDHQWDEYWNPVTGRWTHWDINYPTTGIGHVWHSGEGINHTRKTISTITAFRPDDSFQATTRTVANPPGSGYMPGDSGYTETAHVTFKVIDATGIPVDGAMVLARSHWDNRNMVSFITYTDETGLCYFDLGYEPNGGYTIDVISPFGTTGSMNFCVSEGLDYHATYRVPGSGPPQQQILFSDNQNLPLQIRLAEATDHQPANQLLYPTSYYAGQLYRLPENSNGSDDYRGARWFSFPASGDCFPVLMNEVEFSLFKAGLDCQAYQPGRTDEDSWYIVFNNRNSFFTWKRFSGNLMPDTQSGPDFHDMEEQSLSTIGSSPPLPVSMQINIDEDLFFTGAITDDESKWHTVFSNQHLQQDDPEDPLSATWVLGPFLVPPDERSLSVTSFSETAGLDMDLFLFRDLNGNRTVDGINECIARSTSPTANESIFEADPDSNAVYWIYMQGWSVPEGENSIDLDLSFRFIPVYFSDLVPCGFIDQYPDSFQVFFNSEDIEAFTFNAGVNNKSSRVEIRENLITFFSGEVDQSKFDPWIEALDESGNVLEKVGWTVLPDENPAVFGIALLSLSDQNRIEIEVPVSDDISGISMVEAYLDEDHSTVLRFSDEDSLYSGSIDRSGLEPGMYIIRLTAADSAGNDISEELDLDLPPGPAVVFHHVSPTGNTYDFQPLLQVYLDVAEVFGEFEIEMTLLDSDGSIVDSSCPISIEHDFLQFRPSRILSPGDYSVNVCVLPDDGSEPVFHSWDFTATSMKAETD